MKKAIAYIRISTKDQSNFSLTGQEQYIRDFATKQGYQVIEVFKDDGQSAKNFDRPDWKLLQKFCKENYHQVDALIVAKYDRFSRNLKEALNMIETLEGTYNIRILSALEPILLNPHSPYFFQFRTQMLMGAQVEWLIIKDRTKAGINTALKSGRFINAAPYGYINKRDENNKPIIVPDEAKADIVRQMYQMFLQGASLKEIHLQARRMGYKNRSHSAVKWTLQSPTYAGLIKVRAYNDEPEYLIKGIHQAIVSEADWHAVQQIFKNKNNITRTVMNEEVPLRQVLKCAAGSPMTAGNSKGKKKYFWYYKCKCHPRINLSAIRLHNQLDELLKALSLPQHYILYLQESLHKKIAEQKEKAQDLLIAKKRELQGIQQKLDSVEEKYITGDIDKEAYKKWRQRYQQDIAICQQYITEASQPIEKLMELINNALPKLAHLDYHYQQADLHKKQAILRLVFNSQLYYHDGCYRTPWILPGFSLKAATLKEKRLLIIEQPLQKTEKIQECAPTHPSIEHLTQLLKLIA